MTASDHDWDQIGHDAARMLSELIQINTTNPPGAETAACEYLKPLYEELGLAVEIVEPEPGRGSIVGRINAKNPEGEPLALLSHLDVVPADPEGWSEPPFAGAIKDGFVYGRGAIDCKNATVAEWQALKLLVESGRELKRDVVLAATADEEAGGARGVEWIIKNRPELLDVGYCVNEGGGFGFSAGEHEVYFCQTSEKGVCWLQLTATGRPGHASVPSPGSAMDRMLDALAAIRALEPEFRITNTVRELVQGIGAALGESVKLEEVSDQSIAAMLELSSGSSQLKHMLGALTKNTMAVTMVHGGTKANVIPAKVEATIDCRVVPGTDPRQLLAKIRETAAPFKVEVDPLVLSSGTEIESGGELYQALNRALLRSRPGAGMTPFMIPGGTDGRFLIDAGVQVLGFIPVAAEPDGEISVLRRAHGIDERVAITDLAFATKILHHALVDFCAK